MHVTLPLQAMVCVRVWRLLDAHATPESAEISRECRHGQHCRSCHDQNSELPALV